MSDHAYWNGLASGFDLVDDQDNQHCYQASGAAELGFPIASFREMLADIVSRSFPDGVDARECRDFIRTLHLPDLVLARACACGLDPAWQRFLALYRDKLFRFAAGMTHEDSAAHELADSLYADLYGFRVEEQGRRVSKLAFYMGRSPLQAWLCVIVAQEYVNRYRKQRRLLSFDDTAQAPPQPSPGDAHSFADRQKLAAATDTGAGAPFSRRAVPVSGLLFRRPHHVRDRPDARRSRIDRQPWIRKTRHDASASDRLPFNVFGSGVCQKRRASSAVSQLPSLTPNFFAPLTRRILAASSGLSKPASAASYASRRTAASRPLIVPAARPRFSRKIR